MSNIEKKSFSEKEILKESFIRSLPILCSYMFLSLAYGMMMEEAGMKWYFSGLASIFVYTGAFQFMLITLLSSGASIITIAVTALLMNSRQLFYSLTYIDEFPKMGKLFPYMIHSLTDETYAVNLTLESTGEEKRKTMFWIAVFSQTYWITGSILGGVLGQLIPFDMTGIDFCMTALFIIIFIDQWEKTRNHFPAITGLVVAVIGLLVVGKQNFMLPALLIVSGILLFTRDKEER